MAGGAKTSKNNVFFYANEAQAKVYTQAYALNKCIKIITPSIIPGFYAKRLETITWLSCAIAVRQ